jgi:hypothetical protein
MVIGLLILTAIPTVTGVAQAISAQKTREERLKDERRMKKFHIDVHCEAESSRTQEIHGKRLVLRDESVWIGPPEALNPCKEGYVAEAFYIEYPDNEVRDPKRGLRFPLCQLTANRDVSLSEFLFRWVWSARFETIHRC